MPRGEGKNSREGEVVSSGRSGGRTGVLRSLEFAPDGVYLTVQLAEGVGEAEGFAALEEEIAGLGIPGVDWDKVREAVSSGKRTLIAPPQEELAAKGKIVVSLSPDEMEAAVVVYPPARGDGPTREDVLRALAEKGVVSGIDPAQVEAVLGRAGAQEPVVVARGKEPVAGADARITYYFPTEARLRPGELDDGRVDYYNLNRVFNVEPGQVLATKAPATAGEPGFTVTGRELPARPGRDVPLLPGKNTELREGGLSLIATARGHPVLQGGRVHVLPVFEVAGDVNFATGNIDFVGSVRIHGGVRYGFTVRAEGDIEVARTIEGGILVAGGNVTGKEGIRGLGKGRVVAKGNVSARFLENVTVEAAGDVIVGEAIMHSHVSAGGKIVVGGRKGVIVGGVCRAGEDIEAKVVGSYLATATELEVGVNPELRRAYNRVCTEKSEAEEHLEKVEKALALLQSLQAEGKALPEEKKALFIKLTRTRFQLQRKLEKLREEEESLREALGASERGRVKVKDVLYPGVTIRVGQVTYYVRDELKYVTILLEEGEVKILPYA